MPGENIYTETDIVAGCLKKDRKFQEALYKKYSRAMYGICLAYAKDRASAQDMLQEGFIKVFNKMESFTGKGSLEAWVRRIITNTSIDKFRKDSAERKYIDFREPELAQGIQENILEQINLKQILGVLKKLPEGARVIFNLYALEGYSHLEISKKLKISVGTSKSQFNRARILLQRRVADLGMSKNE